MMETVALLVSVAAGLAVGLTRSGKLVASGVAVPVLVLMWFSLQPLGSNDGALLFLLGGTAYGGLTALALRPARRATSTPARR
ncbi:MAG: hypothetical protein PIR53_07045 [Nocardioides alkalitolerans]